MLHNNLKKHHNKTISGVTETNQKKHHKNN